MVKRCRLGSSLLCVGRGNSGGWRGSVLLGIVVCCSCEFMYRGYKRSSSDLVETGGITDMKVRTTVAWCHYLSLLQRHGAVV